MCTLSNINISTACTVRVTTFSTGGKFHPVSTVTCSYSSPRFYALLINDMVTMQVCTKKLELEFISIQLPIKLIIIGP